VQVNALRTGIGLAAAGIATATALDVAIDRSNHDHDGWAYQHGSWPTKALFRGGGALLVAGLAAKLLPATRGASTPLLKLGAASLGAWGATFAVRLGVGTLTSPHDGGFRWNPGDLAANAVDRCHMMSRETHAHEDLIFDWISRAQGHGSLAERTARGDFEPIWPE
jgi:hypothetical protein